MAGLISTDKGMLCSERGFQDLLNEQECLNAVKFATSVHDKAKLVHTLNNANKPKGCYIYPTNGQMNFNYHPSGKSALTASSICKIGNKLF